MLTTLSILTLCLAWLPLLICLDNLRHLPPPPLAQASQAVSVLIPARNEAGNIADAVAHVLASSDVTIELVVLDDASTDATPAILAAIDDKRLRVLTGTPLPPGWCGKQHACAALAFAAQHDIMIFIDADVRLAPDAIARIARHIEAERLDLASGFPRQALGSWGERLLLPLIHVILLGYLPLARANRSPSPSLAAGCGQLMAVRRDAYIRAGGHQAIRASLHDGIMLPRAFRRAGLRTRLFDATDLASCRMYHGFHETWDGLGKNATEGMARPVALPVWTVLLAGGHILPVIMAFAAPGPFTALALVAPFLLRLVLARRFANPATDVWTHPFGIALLLARQWTALVRALLGRPATWRGRNYQAPP